MGGSSRLMFAQLSDLYLCRKGRQEANVKKRSKDEEKNLATAFT
jgi:hypothetical protein